ncbi:glycosyltransferase family 10 [Mucilaginibacter sp.]|uniref:glycosyltransferase family 10 domain-containing protein n=1 Tax=Mucilaginibacter sp. TaxID=1882438 RepID=UPI00260C0606|nr:glycosyltransferase family 10 [Mucilaginibacter sp.]MDB4926966.1 hypothetical protein [Mucilaginibacter sp.]
MPKPIINIRFQNGLTFQTFKKEVFDINGVSALFDFEEADDPDFIVFGPYGNDIPPKGNYIRIGYFCENIKPDLSICEWAFGIPKEEEVNDPCYKRIQWHGTNPQSLIKPANHNSEEIDTGKKFFCNFLYSHHVFYREEFFRQLSKYKKVDAPGKSMKNMQTIDEIYKGDIWERKRQFLADYKFTIAFENCVYPGYQTEKLYDAMLTNSIPIYFGDPFIGEIFNTASFINATDYLTIKYKWLLNLLQKISQPDFTDIRPAFYKNPLHKIKRKLKIWGRDIMMRIHLKSINFKPLIIRIQEVDTDRDEYIKMLQQPWLTDNKLPVNTLLKNRWIEIFESNNE